MASLSDADDDDMELLMRDYCMPTMAEITTESLLTKSQYAKVIFHDLLPCYPTDADVCCRYSVTEGVTVRQGDKVALFRVGWSSINEYLLAESVPMPERPDGKEFQILFKSESLPKDSREFYQLCYVNVDGCVCGASVPIQFRRARASELREVEEAGLVVIQSHTAIQAEKLLGATTEILKLEARYTSLKSDFHDMTEELEHSRTSLESAQRDLLQLVAEKGTLYRENEGLTAEIKELALECKEKSTKNEDLLFQNEDLRWANTDLTDSVEKVSSQKEKLKQENEALSVRNEELANTTKELLTKNAELSFQNEELKLENKKMLLCQGELRASLEEMLMKNAEVTAKMEDLEQEKVHRDRDMGLLEWTIRKHKNVEEMVQTLGEEKANLKQMLDESTQRGEREVWHLRGQLEGLQQMLDVSTQSKEMAAQALRAEQAKVKQLGIEKRDLEISAEQQGHQHASEMAAVWSKLQDSEERLTALAEKSACDQRASVSAFDPLLDEYEDMRRRVNALTEENHALETARRENQDLRQQLHQAAQESAGASALEAENEALRAENGVLGRQLQQLRLGGAMGKRREVDAAQGQAKADARLMERDSEVEALLNENRLLVSRMHEMQSLQETEAADCSRSLTSLISANEKLISANEGLTLTNEKLVKAVEAGGAAKVNNGGSQLRESRGCLDLSHTIKVMDLQNRKGDAELALADALAAESTAWDDVTLAQEQLQQLALEERAVQANLDVSGRDLDKVDLEAVKLGAAMKHLQEAILSHDDDTPNGIPEGDEVRLAGLLQRWDELAVRRTETESMRHDLCQDAAVLRDRRTALEAQAVQADAQHKQALSDKHQLLQTLISLDDQALALTGVRDALAVSQDGVTGAQGPREAQGEERLVAEHDLEGDGAQGGGAAPSLSSMGVGWELVGRETTEKKERGTQSEVETELCQRLDLAAAEYRTLFLEKARLKKQLSTQEKHVDVLQKQLEQLRSA